jgi:methyl-accepting chemotaxis protein
MSLDDISVRIGISDISSLKEAATLMKQVHAFTGKLLTLVGSTEKGVDKLSAKISDLSTKSEELDTISDRLGNMFRYAFQYWENLRTSGQEHISGISRELNEITDSARSTASSLKSIF